MIDSLKLMEIYVKLKLNKYYVNMPKMTRGSHMLWFAVSKRMPLYLWLYARKDDPGLIIDMSINVDSEQIIWGLYFLYLYRSYLNCLTTADHG